MSADNTSTLKSPPRYSPVHDAQQRLRPRWTMLDGMSTALAFGGADDEHTQAAELALCDVSGLARVTLKGPGAAEFLKARKIGVPDEIMGVSLLDEGGLIARTGGNEFFLEDGLHGTSVANIEGELGTLPPRCYRIVRQDASLLLSGRRAAEVLLETCGYDFREPPKMLVMTRVAGVSCSILFRELGGIDLFQLWLDGTYGEYLWHTLEEIVRELDGAVVGVGPFFPELLKAPGAV